MIRFENERRFPFIFQILFLIFFSCHSTNQKQATQKQYASLIDSTRYVGINTCRQCHQDKYETFIRTGMGLSFDIASHKKSSGKFDEHAFVYDKFKDFYYKPFWNGDSLYLNEFRLQGKDTIYQRTEQINYIVGSGQHTNSHMTNENGYIYQVPATFYTQKGQWDLPPGFENGFNSRFDRKIELECMSCHNAYPKIVLGSENKYEYVPNGIDCERCHGPGSEHVNQKQAGHLVDVTKEIDYSIVNPAKLPIDLQLDVCQRCHIQGNAVLKEGKSFFDFRPAQHLSDVMDVYMPLFKGDEASHIMASHAERLKISHCFIESKRKAEEETIPIKSGGVGGSASLFPYKDAMTCVTCHNPHISVRETSHSYFNTICQNCHHDAHASLAAHITKSDTFDCVKCHMPRNNTIDIPHVITTDHYIRKLVKETEVKKIREFVTLACINNPNTNSKSRGEAFLNYYEKLEPHSYALDSAKKYFTDKTEDDIKNNFKDLVRWAYLKNDFAKVISYAEHLNDVSQLLSKQSYSNDDAWTAYRIAIAYYSSDNGEKAISFLQKAVDLAPYQFDFRNKLAQVLYEAGKNEEARNNFEFIIKENPEYSSAYVSLGYLILTADHNIELADSYYDHALALDPDNEQAMFNKAGALIYLNRKKDAVTMLHRLLKRNPNREDAKAVLQSLTKKG